jgi:hypothetical protein
MSFKAVKVPGHSSLPRTFALSSIPYCSSISCSPSAASSAPMMRKLIGGKAIDEKQPTKR